MKHWTSHSGYTPLWLNPEMKIKLRDLTPGSVVEATGETLQGLTRVIYCGEKNYIGWVDSQRIELYIENYAKDCVNIRDIQTPDKQDAEQYVLWKQKRQVNMCGEMSVCYTLNIRLAHLLERWEGTAPPFWKSVFGSGMARGTTAAELVRMYDLFDVKASPLAIKRYTPETVARMTGAIVSVKMNPRTGRLASSGVGHWVVVTDTMTERIGYGTVNVYNPYPNRIEVYSWAEFAAAAGTPYGAMVIDASYPQERRGDGQLPYPPAPEKDNA